MKKRIIAVMAVICVCLMSITGCSSDGKNNNSATDDRANKNTTSPTDMIDKAGEDLDKLGGDVKNDADKVGDDVKNDADKVGDDVKNGADTAGDDIKNGVEKAGDDLKDSLGGTDNANASPNVVSPTNNANDMVTDAPNK